MSEGKNKADCQMKGRKETPTWTTICCKFAQLLVIFVRVQILAMFCRYIYKKRFDLLSRSVKLGTVVVQISACHRYRVCPLKLYWLRPWLHLTNSRKFPSRMKGIHQVEPKRKLRFLVFCHQEIKKNSQLEKFSKTRGTDQRNFLVEPKQKILKMCHFPRINIKKFWNWFPRINCQTALPHVKLSTKLLYLGCKMNCIKFSNFFQSGKSCWPWSKLIHHHFNVTFWLTIRN